MSDRTHKQLEMQWEPIRERVSVSLQALLTKDSELLAHGLFEPCVSHRLGMYLQDGFPELHVDCEYDRMLTKNRDGAPRWDQKGLDKNRPIADIATIKEAIQLPASKDIDLFVGRRRSLQYYFDKAQEQVRALNGPAKLARPDILVHKRDADRNNLLVIEMKLGAGDKCRVPVDLAKLVEFTTQPTLHYAFGLFLTFRSQVPHLQCALLFVEGCGFRLRTDDLRFHSEEPWYEHHP